MVPENVQFNIVVYGTSDSLKRKQFVIGQALESKLVNNEKVLSIVEKTGQTIPLSLVVKSILELPNVFETVISYVGSLN